jgi:hypothetical protein
MPQFVTISPTHIPVKKEYAWNKFRNDGYIAIGWMHDDLTEKSPEEVEKIIRSYRFPNENSAIETFKKFISLKIGDYVAVNNANAGLFGVGIIESGYQFKLKGHDTGTNDHEEFYSHLRKVKWVFTTYVRRKDVLEKDETGWQPYGTMGIICEEIPLYIRRLLGEKPPAAPITVKFDTPDFLRPLIERIVNFRKEDDHHERGHESLVEDFFVILGYKKDADIKYRLGRIDISLWNGKRQLAVVEVKRDWNMSMNNAADAVKQAYWYAHETGSRLVIVTNGDDYLLFDRIKGLSLNSNMIGQFRLSSLVEDDIQTISRLRLDSLKHPNVQEVLNNISECFGDQ